jgi:protein transport protein SEC24
MTQQFSQMDMSQKPQPQTAPQRGPVLNQLYPTDLLNQPFNVQELDYPPPLAILPPNVSVNVDFRFRTCKLTCIDQCYSLS